MCPAFTRRGFLKTSSFLSAGMLMGLKPESALGYAANEKLNMGVVGVHGQGSANLAGVSSQTIAAVCDVDQRCIDKAVGLHPAAKHYYDFRKMLDQKDIEAVVVSTPDHTHAVVAVAALESGRHVYCEKPLARTVYEVRAITEAAKKHNRVTQMGTQIHAGANYRRVVELVVSNAIGPVREVHVWCGKNWGGGELPRSTPPVPDYLDYDLWLGPAAYRPYHPIYLPANWRRWWAFGGGTLADMACHYMDLPFWALKLRYPLSVESQGPPVHKETAPVWNITTWEYPARGDWPPVKLTWYDGGKRPALLEEVKPPEWGNRGKSPASTEEAKPSDEGDGSKPPAPPAEVKPPQWGDGVLFVGDKGMLFSDYSRHKLLPEEDFADFSPPAPFIPDSMGHHAEWIHACKHGGPTTCDFNYSGPLAETVVLGNAAYRVGKKMKWNGQALKSPDCPEAMEFLRPSYREGWKL